MSAETIPAGEGLAAQIARDVAAFNALPADEQQALHREFATIGCNPGIVFTPLAAPTIAGEMVTEAMLLAVERLGLGVTAATAEAVYRAMLAAALPASDGLREAPWRDLRAVDAALDAEWATDAGGDVPAVGPKYSIREVMEAFGSLSTREMESAMATALQAAFTRDDNRCEEITYDRDGPR